MVEITGILPTYNRAALIDRAIQSMLRQSLPLDEIIVVDDGSRDETGEIVGRYNDRVRYIFQQNSGGGAARNRGVEEARTPWVAFLDSDDLWTADHLERLSRAIDLTGGRADLYFDDTKRSASFGSRNRWELSGFDLQGNLLLAEDGTEWVMRGQQPMMLQASVVKRRRFLEVGGFWEQLRTAHDTHFFLRLGIGRPLCAVAGVGAIQTEDDIPSNRLTVQTGPVKLSRWVNRARLYQDILERYPQLDLAYKIQLRERVCESRWDAAKGNWGRGDILRALTEAWLSFSSEPHLFVGKFNPFRLVAWLGNRPRP